MAVTFGFSYLLEKQVKENGKKWKGLLFSAIVLKKLLSVFLNKARLSVVKGTTTR